MADWSYLECAEHAEHEIINAGDDLIDAGFWGCALHEPSPVSLHEHSVDQRWTLVDWCTAWDHVSSDDTRGAQ